MTAEQFYFRGHKLLEAGESAAALACFDAAIAARSSYVEAHCSRGILLVQLGRFAEALADHDEAVRLRPNMGALHFNRAGALENLGRFEDALSGFRRAAELSPADPALQYALGYRLARRGRYGEARQALERAIRLQPDHVGALVDYAALLLEARQFEAAAAVLERASLLPSSHFYLAATRLQARMQLCDWRDFDAECARLLNAIMANEAGSMPLTLLTIASRPEHQFRATRRYVTDYCPAAAVPLRPHQPRKEGRIRVAYLSASLRDHPVTFLISDIFPLQDRARFEIMGIGYAADDGSVARRQVEKGFDRFIDASHMSEQETARLVRDLEIDIAVDLDGYSQGSRIGVLAERPAPLQVSFLGYPGTLGADYVDYVIADGVVIPEGMEHYYSEKIVRLPGCYQPNSRRMMAEQQPRRADCGLPDDAMVFCCFNNSHKITPDIFAVWIRLLAAIDGSVLWLLESNPTARANLVREAGRHGIAASRLVFAPFLPHAEHLARIGLADLFLDTLYYNAHTTASDALWAGVPVLTLMGQTFASRVGASLLITLGLDELIVHALPAYEAKALALARDPAARAALRAKLERARETSPLFDTTRFARQLDDALETMWRIYCQGLPAAGFGVAPAA